MEQESAILALKGMGIPLPEDLLLKVRDFDPKGEIREQEALSDRDTDGAMYDGRHHLWLYETPDDAEDQEDPCYYDTIPQAWKDEVAGVEITPDMWVPPGAPEKLERELIEFILSANPRFDRIKAYKPFFLYCEAARRWNLEPGSIDQYELGSQDWVDYGLRELWRGEVNHLYWLDRYDTIKDDATGGRRNYKASTPQALLSWVVNCRISAVVKKGRHAAITSTMMALASLRTQLIKSYKGILVTDDVEETGKSIFEDKFLSTMMNRPWWMRPQDDFKHFAASSTLRIMLQFGASGSKGSKKKSTTEFGVFAGKDSQAINGTTPTDLYIDEGQNVAKLMKIINERRPTQWAKVDGRLRLVRATYCWGTAASDDKGKGSLEEAYDFIKDKMERGEDTGGWLAIFFDGFCRPGVTASLFKKEYVRIVGGQDTKSKSQSFRERKAFFSSFFPMSDDDVSSGIPNTVVPVEELKRHREKCQRYLPGGATRGRFVEVYDKSSPMPPGSHYPYRVEGAMFQEAKLTDLTAPVWMFQDRENGWFDNYYQGTDPIQSNTGLSRMASNILAASAAQHREGGRIIHIPASVCWVNGRTDNPYDMFKQVKLMGMYYRNEGQKACPELVEYDQGHNYIEFCKSPAMMLEESLLWNAELPPMYQTQNRSQVGILMREAIKSRMHLDLLNFMDECGKYEMSYEFFTQMMNITQDETGANSKIKWGTIDVRRSNDDLVIAKVLSYINYKRANMMPRKIGQQVQEYEEVMEPVRMADGSYIWAPMRRRVADNGEDELQLNEDALKPTWAYP